MPRIPTTTLTVLLLFGAAGCRNTLPCTGCEEPADVDADAGDGDEPLPDLPCGGADLMTDNLNCGTCGNECWVWYEGSQYQAGGCEQGECSRSTWSICSTPYFGATCEEVCGGRECLPGGCSGLTAMVFEVLPFHGCPTSSELTSGDYKPVMLLTGACDEPIPWEPQGHNQFAREAMCCCESEAPP